MYLETPRLIVAGLAGDSGKTLVTLGLTRAFRNRGLVVAAAKKGPDYIDAAWLAAASGRPGRNLDTYLMSDEGLAGVVERSCEGSQLLVIEGNRGLHDGFDAQGSHSTAELANKIDAPVILVIDVTKMTRTTAAIVNGCAALDPKLNLAGVVLNQVATRRQEKVIRAAIETYCQVPVLGAVPRLSGDTPLPGRHLGLVTAVEHPDTQQAIERACQVVEDHLDLDQIETIARSAPKVKLTVPRQRPAGEPVRIGVFRDAAFSFYYPENLESLEQSGAELIEISPLEETELPSVDGLYIGGGFPEVHAQRLSANKAMRRQVAQAAGGGLPIYAECGGLIYLSRELRDGETVWPMSGVLDLVVEQTSKPQGHGYMKAQVDGENRFFPSGTELRGHEFHYSQVVGGEDASRGVLDVVRGHGVFDGRDGLVVESVWASYLHLHAMGTPDWADGLLEQSRAYRARRAGQQLAWG